MSIIERTFVWDYDSEFDINGWIPKDSPGFNAGTGMTVAHDMMEHTDFEDHSLEAEMQAFGAGLFVRHNGGYWPSQVGYDSIASGNLCEFLHIRGFKISEPPVVGELDAHNERQLKALVGESMGKFIFASIFSGVALPDYDTLYDVLKRAIGWMRIGYRRAQERYAGHSPREVCNLYKRVEQVIDGEYNRADKGDELHIEIMPDVLQYTINLTKKD